VNRKTLLAVLVASAALVPSAHAGTFYVDDDAAASAPACTAPGTPCKTIGDAVTQARLVAGPNAIVVAPGTYAERVVLDQAADAGLVVDGAGATADPTVSTLIAPASATGSLVVLGADAVGGQTLKDVRVVHLPAITDQNGVALVGAGSYVENVAVDVVDDAPDQGAGFTVSRPARLQTISVSGTYDGDGLRAIGSAPFEVDVRDATILAGTQRTAITASTYASVRIQRSVLRANQGTALRLAASTVAGTAVVDSSLLLGGVVGVDVTAGAGVAATATLRGVTIDPGAAGTDPPSLATSAATVAAGAVATVVLADSIAVDAQRATASGGGASTVACAGSDVPAQEQAAAEGLGTIGCAAAGGNVASDVDLLFVSPAGGDYRLHAASPAVDAGSAAPLAADESATDLAGLPRVADGNVDCVATRDRGAYELQLNALPSAVAIEVGPQRRAGLPVTFAGSAVDDQAPESLRYAWTFPGGGTAMGRSVAHTFRTAGRQSVTLTVTDANSCSASATVALDLAPDAVAPTLTRLALRPAIFRTAGKKRGTVVRFTLSEPGTVRLAIERRRAGKPARWKPVGVLLVVRKAGARTFAWNGKLAGRALRPGGYRLRATLRDAGRNRSNERIVPFRIRG
jgi:hypothetical protein